MQKKVLLFCCFFMLCIGIKASEVSVVNPMEVAGQSEVFADADYEYYMSGYDGETVTVPLASDFSNVLGASYMTATVNSSSVTFTLNYSAWVAEGQPSVFNSQIISGGVRYRIVIYIGVKP